MTRSDFPGEIQLALLRLSDALCSFERASLCTSVLVLRMANGAEYRAANGKPNVPDDIADAELFASESCEEPTR